MPSCGPGNGTRSLPPTPPRMRAGSCETSPQGWTRPASRPSGTTSGSTCSTRRARGATIRRLDPDGIEPPRRINTGNVHCEWAFDTTRTGQVGFVGASATAYQEAWALTDDGPRQLTSLNSQLGDWQFGQVRTITWTNRGRHRDRGRPAHTAGLRSVPPLSTRRRRARRTHLVRQRAAAAQDGPPVLPGGPAGRLKACSCCTPTTGARSGRGLDFQELNVGNLGVGDLWDLESAIDHLDRLGWIDTSRIGCMGWSQGGYISAFAALHSDRFAAV